jgi:soluble lytic murein transglycosylase-like protein
MPKRFLISMTVLILTAVSSASDYAVMRNGFALKHERREVIGAVTRLYLNAEGTSSFVDVPSTDIERFEQDEVVIVPEAAKPAPAPVLTIDQSISQAGEKHHIDPDFITSLVRAESGFHPRAISPKGARGLMQLMPKTAADLGVKDPFDSNENVEAGTRYLRELLEQYDYDAVKALAAYNAGPDRVTRFHGVPPFNETRSYVNRIVSDYNRKKRADDRIAPKPKQSVSQKAPRKKSAVVADNAAAQR